MDKQNDLIQIKEKYEKTLNVVGSFNCGDYVIYTILINEDRYNLHRYIYIENKWHCSIDFRGVNIDGVLMWLVNNHIISSNLFNIFNVLFENEIENIANRYI